ncbi:MAG: RNA polymerase sigma factor [Phycisphaeraceae bacterium]|nr:RNA polymerase sigma factor [Phycisphaeraceae bacterium]
MYLEGQNPINETGKTEEISITGLIEQARQGDQDSMGQLAEVAEARLLPYIYRLTLNYDLTEELCQQTLAKMIQSLNKLEHIERFWAWLYRSAMGEVQHHYRKVQRQRRVEIAALNKARFCQYVEQDHADGLSYSERTELAQIVVQGMSKLHLAYRNVLVLRCYENLSYAEIGKHLDCKDLHAKVLFYRAKKMLKNHLARQGFGKETFLTALGLFGLMTVPAKGSAAWAVKATALNAGLLAAVTATVAGRLCVLCVTAISAITALILENPGMALGIVGLSFASIIAAACIELFKA